MSKDATCVDCNKAITDVEYIRYGGKCKSCWGKNRKSFHYEWFAYTDNLNYGRLLLGQGKTRREAKIIGRCANKGCFVVERHRVYNN